MSEDLRLRHDADTRREAARLFAIGYGYGPVASMMSLPEETVRKWLYTFRAVGLEGLLNMGKTQAKYSWELKCAAAKAVVEDGMPVVEVMAAYGVASRSPLNKWCKLYREGGAEALRPKPRGRPGGSGGKPKQLTREQELERRVQKLEDTLRAGQGVLKFRDDSADLVERPGVLIGVSQENAQFPNGQDAFNGA